MIAEIQRLREELLKMKSELKKKDAVIVQLQNKLGAVLGTLGFGFGFGLRIDRVREG